MNKINLLFILSISYFGFIFANTDQLETKQQTIKIGRAENKEISDWIHKQIIQTPQLRASSFQNISIKTLGSSASGLLFFYLYCIITKAIYFETSNRGYSFSIISSTGMTSYTGQGSTSSKTLKIYPIQTILGLGISSYAIIAMYKMIHNYILGTYQKQAVKNIMEKWNLVKHTVPEKVKNILDNTNAEYNRNPNNVDFDKVVKQLLSLIENKRKAKSLQAKLSEYILNIFS